MKSDGLNLLEATGPLQACNGIALPLFPYRPISNTQSCFSFTPLDCDSVDVIPVWHWLLISECPFNHNCDRDCDFEYDYVRHCVCYGVNKCNSDWLIVIMTVTICDCDGQTMSKCAFESYWLTVTLFVYSCDGLTVSVALTDWLTDWLCWNDSDWLWWWIWPTVPASVSFKVNLPVVIICVYLHKHLYQCKFVPVLWYSSHNSTNLNVNCST